MRFADLSQEAAQCLWRRWKYVMKEILREFNQDVFRGKGLLRENSQLERPYLLLQTDHGCLYVFPISEGAVVLRLYRSQLEREHLCLTPTASTFDEENLIGWIGIRINLIEKRFCDGEAALRAVLESVLRYMFERYWLKIVL